MSAPALRVIGEGALARSVRDALRSRTLRTPAVVVLVTRLERLPDAMTSLYCAPVLLVTEWRTFAYVGPVRLPSSTGCERCLATRLEDSPAAPRIEPGAIAPRGPAVALGARTPAAVHLVRTLVVERLDRIARGEDGHAHEVTVYDAATSSVHTYGLIPDSSCVSCGAGISRSTAPPFRQGMPTAPTIAGTLRARPLNGAALERYVSPVGLFRRLRADLQAPFAATSVEVPLVAKRRREPALGRAPSFRTSAAIAILEGLERYCGYHCGGRVVTIRATYDEIAARAIDPRSFGTHPEESYERPDFPFQRFERTLQMRWVEAYSFARRRSVLVPHRTAFWGPGKDDEPAFVYETSNGCAVGASIEEATLHALREVVERDSFLLAWYRRLRLPEIDLIRSDAELRATIGKCELVTRAKFRAFLSTMEHGFPSVWLVAECEGREGPAILAGAAAHSDLRRAVLNGIEELAYRVLGIRHRYEARRADALPMLDDPFLVRTLEDHPLVNALPEARDRFAFLLRQSGASLCLQDAATSWRPSEDISQELLTAADAMLRAGLDVLVVDQTMNELSHSGYSCVKVLIPGLVPMTFGHINRRTARLPRLDGLTSLPYVSDLAPGTNRAELPHPFD